MFLQQQLENGLKNIKIWRDSSKVEHTSDMRITMERYHLPLPFLSVLKRLKRLVCKTSIREFESHQAVQLAGVVQWLVYGLAKAKMRVRFSSLAPYISVG